VVKAMIDEEMAEIRRIRHEISAQFGHDPRKLADYYHDLEEKYRQSGEFKFAQTSTDKSKQGKISQI
jgi:hypothetical protein